MHAIELDIDFKLNLFTLVLHVSNQSNQTHTQLTNSVN